VSATAHPATVVLADSYELFRSAFVESLDSEPDIKVVGATGTGDMAESLVCDLAPDLLITATHLDQRHDGIRLCRRVRSGARPPAVLLLLDEQVPSEILSALESGALGTVARQDRLEDVMRNIRAALRGEACVPRRMLGGVLGALIARRRETDEVQGRYERLSRREREVLALLAEGRDHTQIASTLVISPQTARTHIQNILEKLEVHSRVEAAGLALEHGLTTVQGGVP
jgi:DNA-binding NarL/FixJ family response regulator